MIERLQRALEHVAELPPDVQEQIAERIENALGMTSNQPTSRHLSPIPMPDFPDDVDEMFDALDRIRHANAPTPPIEPDGE